MKKLELCVGRYLGGAVGSSLTFVKASLGGLFFKKIDCYFCLQENSFIFVV